MDTPTTALSRVEAVLQASETGLFLHQIAREAHVNEKEAKEAVKALNARAQIETIPTPGRWGSRYAWLAAKPLPKEATPEAPAGQPETRMNTAPEPEAPADSGQESAAEQATITGDTLPEIPMLEGTPEEAILKAFAESGLTKPDMTQGAELAKAAYREQVETPNRYAKALARLFSRIENPRYLVLVPKRKPRIVTSRARAEALALAAVRRGAPAAEVCELESIGTARRDAVFVEVG